MVKKKLPQGQVNRRNNQTLEALTNLMNDLGQKYSIKVGILQSKGGSDIAPDTDLSRADLGAIHEFGATINVTKKMRGYFWSKYKIHKTNNPIKIPARPFLRPLLQKKSKDFLLNSVAEDRELNKLLAENNPQFIETIAYQVAVNASLLVKHAFNAGGYPNKWKDITSFTRENRKYNKQSPPLTDSGWLQKKSYEYEVKKVN